eukprot:365389-Chlamydomonas_euryale.AAC.5
MFEPIASAAALQIHTGPVPPARMRFGMHVRMLCLDAQMCGLSRHHVCFVWTPKCVDSRAGTCALSGSSAWIDVRRCQSRPTYAAAQTRVHHTPAVQQYRRLPCPTLAAVQALLPPHLQSNIDGW